MIHSCLWLELRRCWQFWCGGRSFLHENAICTLDRRRVMPWLMRHGPRASCFMPRPPSLRLITALSASSIVLLPLGLICLCPSDAPFAYNTPKYVGERLLLPFFPSLWWHGKPRKAERPWQSIHGKRGQSTIAQFEVIMGLFINALSTYDAWSITVSFSGAWRIIICWRTKVMYESKL